MFQIGIRSAVKTGKFDQDALAAIANAGFHLVELSFNMPQDHLDFADNANAKSLRRAAERMHMRLTAHASYYAPLAVIDQAVSEKTTAFYLAVLDGMAKYGARQLVVHACADQSDEPEHVAIRLSHLLYALKRLEPTCAAARIRLALETMIPGFLTGNLEFLIQVIDAINSPWIGICLDTNHLNLSTPLSAAILRAGPRIFEFHLNDNHGASQEHLLPYEGTIDWKSFSAAVAAIGYDGDLILEPELLPGKSSAALIIRARQAGQKLLAEIQSNRNVAG